MQGRVTIKSLLTSIDQWRKKGRTFETILKEEAKIDVDNDEDYAAEIDENFLMNPVTFKIYQYPVIADDCKIYEKSEADELIAGYEDPKDHVHKYNNGVAQRRIYRYEEAHDKLLALKKFVAEKILAKMTAEQQPEQPASPQIVASVPAASAPAPAPAPAPASKPSAAVVQATFLRQSASPQLVASVPAAPAPRPSEIAAQQLAELAAKAKISQEYEEEKRQHAEQEARISQANEEERRQWDERPSTAQAQRAAQQRQIAEQCAWAAKHRATEERKIAEQNAWADKHRATQERIVAEQNAWAAKHRATQERKMAEQRAQEAIQRIAQQQAAAPQPSLQPSRAGLFKPAIAPQPGMATSFDYHRPSANLLALYSAITSVKSICKSICDREGIHQSGDGITDPLDFHHALISGIHHEAALRALLTEFHLTGLITLYLDERRTEDFYKISGRLHDEFEYLFDQAGDDIMNNLRNQLHYKGLHYRPIISLLSPESQGSETNLFFVDSLLLEGILSPHETEESLLKKLLPVDQISYAGMKQ